MNPLQRLIAYLRSSKKELEKVTWPTRQETLRYSALVIAVTVVTAAFFATLDLGFSTGVTWLIERSPNAGTQTTPEPPIVPDLVPSGVEAVDETGAPATDFQIETQDLPPISPQPE